MFLYLVDENLRDEVEEYITTCRGKELPGFVNYRTFENIVKKHVQELEEPASQLLRDVIGKYQQLNQMLFFYHSQIFIAVLRHFKLLSALNEKKKTGEFWASEFSLLAASGVTQIDISWFYLIKNKTMNVFF